jgi:ABC-type Fe3+-siderophore transport system permease subunit
LNWATILFFAVAIVLLWLGHNRSSTWMVWLSGAMVMIGFGAIWPNFSIKSRNALENTGRNFWHWVTHAFTDVQVPSGGIIIALLVVGAALIFVGRRGGWRVLTIVGIILLFAVLSTIFPHFVNQTVGRLEREANIIKFWATHAFKS